MSEQLPLKPSQEKSSADPSMLGGNIMPPSDEELYKQKVEFLEGILQEQTVANLAAQREVLMRAIGGHDKAERVDVWEAVKKQMSRRSYSEVTDILREEALDIAKPEEEKDIFDKIAASVALDMLGVTESNRIQPGIDIVDFNVGSELDDLIDTDELEDHTVLAKATKTIRLLMACGQYKLHKWGDANQLKTALDLVENYTEWVSDFIPEEAGLDEAKASLTTALAALQVDENSKPNYQYAKPERNYLFNQTADGLEQLRKTEAHMFLRYQDLELPQASPDQP